MTLHSLGEFGFLERVRQWVGDGGLLDDAAVLPPTGADALVATTDMLVEGVHFRLAWSSPADVGFKAVTVNVSDLAGMGAEPRYVLVGLGAPADTTEDVLHGVYAGLLEACSAYGAELAGGDTVRTDTLVLAVTALGALDGPALTRAGARPGDVLVVTGPLGRAAAGVNLLLSGVPRHDVPEDAIACIDAHRRPQARLAEGRALRLAGASAGMDLSDGLLSDVRRLAEASGVGAEIDADAVPVAREVRSIAEGRGWDIERIALAGGEDFELLAALPESKAEAVGVPLHRVGRIVDDGLWLVRDGVREPLPEGGWDHFS